MKPAKILHLHSTFNYGGKEARAVRLMNHFGAAAEHTVLSAMPDAMSARDAIAPEIRVDFPTGAPSLEGKPAPGRYRQLAAYMRRFDLVLSYNWGAMDGVMAHCLLCGANDPPLIHHEDGFNQDEAVTLNWKRSGFRRIALKKAYALVVPSVTLFKIARAHWQVPRKRLHRIANGIDIAAYRQACDTRAIPGFTRQEGEIVVGTMAGLRTVKNLPFLVRAVAATGLAMRLVIVGEGPERATILAEAARQGISDRVLLPGFLPDPSRYVGLFDIFALSSDSEQYPISVVEAMAAGLPVIATDVGDTRAIVSPINQPFLYQTGDLAGYVEGLTKLAGSRSLRAAIGAANRERATLENDEQLMLARYAVLYGGAMGQEGFGSIPPSP